jgi:hypothetical protein
MDDFWASAKQLLDVVKEASGHPRLKPLVDRAMRELEGMAETIEKQAAQAKQQESVAEEDHQRRGARHG